MMMKSGFNDKFKSDKFELSICSLSLNCKAAASHKTSHK